MIQEVCVSFENVSLFHKVIKGEIEDIKISLGELDSARSILNDNIQEFTKDFEAIEYFGEEFDKEKFTKVMKDM